MTLDEAMAKAEAQIDAIVEQRQDETVLAMIADGIDEDTVFEALHINRGTCATWRAQTLADLRVTLSTVEWA